MTNLGVEVVEDPLRLPALVGITHVTEVDDTKLFAALYDIARLEVSMYITKLVDVLEMVQYSSPVYNQYMPRAIGHKRGAYFSQS